MAVDLQGALADLDQLHEVLAGLGIGAQHSQGPQCERPEVLALFDDPVRALAAQELAAVETDRRPQPGAGERGVAGRGGAQAGVHQFLEAVEVGPQPGDVQDVAEVPVDQPDPGVAGAVGVGVEHPAQCVGGDLQGAARGGVGAGPQGGVEPVAGEHLAAVDHEVLEQATGLSGPPALDGGAVDGQLEVAQEADPHRRPRRPVRCGGHRVLPVVFSLPLCLRGVCPGGLQRPYNGRIRAV